MQQNLKVLMLNGSPRANGNTSVALKEMEQVFKDNGIETEIILVGNKDIRGCIACGSCYEKGKCVFNDMVNELALKFEEADGLVVASPVYYASANATLIACLDRLFYSSHFDKTMKVGASVVCARRGGCSATFDELNKYFTISGMPVASSQYWNSIHGRMPGESEQDGEGKQTMRTLARNMTFLMKSIALGKEQFGLPEKEERIATHISERYEFRNIKQNEAEEAAEIERICFPPNEACSKKHMKDRVAGIADLFLVAIDKENGKMAGFLNGLATDEVVLKDEFFTDAGLHNPEGKNIMLLGLDVLPEYRSQGLARELVRRYLEREWGRGRKEIILTCLESKVAMYEKFGFKDKGIAQSTWGGEEWHEMGVKNQN